jgi:hypothetical protein
MGWIHYLGRAPSRERLARGDTPAWIANSERRSYIAAVVLSAPPWVDRAALRAIQRRAVWMSEMDGVEYVLDHIVPLNHPMVCGLTVPWNIQIIPSKVNAHKSNKWCPDQMELFA